MAVQLTEAQLAELAEITTEDLVAAQAAFARYADKVARNLLVAELVVEDEAGG